MALPRLGLPKLRKVLEALYLFLEDPPNSIPDDLPIPVSWNPAPPSPLWCPRPLFQENWSPPNWWVEFCKRIDAENLPNDPNNIDPNKAPSWEWLCNTLLSLVCAHLTSDGLSSITNSKLKRNLNDTLQKILDELSNWRVWRSLIQSDQITTRRFRDELDDAIRLLPAPRGRPTKRDSVSDKDFEKKWERARESGVSKKDFCSDNDKSLKEGNQILARVRMARKREKEKRQKKSVKPQN
jgi:hypothetical protein